MTVAGKDAHARTDSSDQPLTRPQTDPGDRDHEPEVCAFALVDQDILGTQILDFREIHELSSSAPSQKT